MDNFKMNIENITIPDSMCFDSGTSICEYVNDNDKVEIEVRGYVTVYFNNERYSHFSDMPKELQELFKSGEAYNDERVQIEEGNWYEIFLNYDEECYVAEIEGMSSEELESYCKEFIEREQSYCKD